MLVIGLVVMGAALPARAVTPDFGSVNWIAQCSTDPPGDQTPTSIDFVGDASHPATYLAIDSNFVYFRYRMNGNPSGPGGFAQAAWVALMNVPAGNPFQYQYLLSLNGKQDTIEIWSNDPATAKDIDFTPLFNDPAETQLFSQGYTVTTAANTGPLAEIVSAGTVFPPTVGGIPDADFFIDFAFPVSVLISKGVVANLTELQNSRFFLSSSNDANNYNKDSVCGFVPQTALSIVKSVTPTSVPVNTTTTGVAYSIVVQNTGSTTATGVEISDPALASYLSNIAVTVSSSSGAVSWTIVSTNPLLVKVPTLPVGATVTVRITADATPHCNDGTSSTNVADAVAINAPDVTDDATLTITRNAPEICNGIDDNCNGQIDEGGDTLCDNGNACDGHETCGGVNGCQSGTSVTCVASDQCHNAGTCDPATGLCSNPAKQNGTSCNDGDACTQTDTCQSGVCTGGNPVVCTASDACHLAGTCDSATGMCSNPNAPNGTSCSDGNACTQSDTCQGGTCTAGNPVVCTALDACHVAGTCNTTTGACSNPNAPNGTSCSDGNACTQTDSCQSGTCTGSNPVVCTAQDQCHDVGVCDPANGSCSNPPKSNGSTCDDGNACTQTDTCQGGSCSGTNPVVCHASDQCHVAGTCDPASGNCSDPTKPNGSACSDGDACSVGDTCQGGSCQSGSPVVCTALDDCHQVGVCNSQTGVCSNPNQPDGTGCNNQGNQCNQNTCVGGVCNVTNTVVCPSPDQCHLAGTCNPSTGMCSNPAKPDGSTCNDGDGCTQTDTCQGGSCSGGNPVVCPTPDQCHDPGVCNSATGICSNPAKPNNTPCDDTNACTQSDTCQNGSCTGSNPVTCTPLDQCHVAGTCDPANGNCSNPNKPDGSACNDTNACTQTDKCEAGTCTGMNPVVCTALNQCHVPGVCEPATGQCTNPIKPPGAPCTDGNACTLTDTCDDQGSCMGAFPVVCSPLDQCHNAGICNTVTGGCSNPPKPNGSACDDGNACTADACQNGACQGTNSVTCIAEDQCHLVGTCDPDTGECSNPTKDNGTLCNDGDACTQTDACVSGVCLGDDRVVCHPLDQCHETGTCDPSTGDCSNPPAPNGTNCDDGNACTIADNCVGGNCTGGGPRDCSTPNPCATGECDSTSGCFVVANPNGTCSDGNACTIGDHCVGTACQPGTTVNTCEDNNICTGDQCNTLNGCFHINLQTPCTDNNLCTDPDVCGDGVCNAGPSVTCTDNNPCTDDACNTTQGCVFTNDDTNPCTDNNFCTEPDHCAGGNCVGTPVNCADNIDCTIDTCDSQAGGFRCDHDATNCPPPPHCGNGVVETAMGETCDPPNLNIDPATGDVICRLDCTKCGDGVLQTAHSEACDDGNTVSGCDPKHPNRALDPCLNTCQAPICHDPARIKWGPQDMFKFHGLLVTDGSAVDFPNQNFVIELQDQDHNVLWRSSLIASSIAQLSTLSFSYRDVTARTDGGMYRLRLKGGVGYYKVYITAYGELGASVSDMTTYVYVGSDRWAVRGQWTGISTGWKLSDKGTFLPVQ